MNIRLHKILLCSLILVISGCSSLRIVDKSPQALTTNAGITQNISDVVGIESFETDNGGYQDADKWQKDFFESLHNEQVYKFILQPVTDKEVIDFLIRGKVSGKFRHNGAKNFLTWWPGPLVFAQGWHGTRYIYDISADVDIIETKSGKIVGKYHADNSHELIHKSYNPWHLFGTLFMFPGIIKGSVSVSPRARYRELIYEHAYPMLWKKIAHLIAKDQSKLYTERIESLRNKCGLHFNEEIKLGMNWTEYTACQSRKFRFLGQENMESENVSVYLSNDREIRIHVAPDGRIVRWYLLKKNKAVQAFQKKI